MNTYILGCAFALSLALIGFVLVRLGVITGKNSKRYAVLAATLAAVSGLWMIERSGLVLGRTVFDVAALFGVLWFFCFFLFWAGIAKGLKTLNRKHGYENDFAESSILSMQYVESRQHGMHDGQDSNFQETQILLDNLLNQIEADALPSVPHDKNVVQIPMTRRNG